MSTTVIRLLIFAAGVLCGWILRGDPRRSRPTSDPFWDAPEAYAAHDGRKPEPPAVEEL